MVNRVIHLNNTWEPGGGGGDPTTVLEETLGATVNGNWNGYTVWNRFDAGTSLGPATGDEIRITLVFESLDNGTEVECWFGLAASPGSSSDVDVSTNVNITFASSAAITGDGVTLTYVSDWVTLAEPFDNANEYLCGIQFDGAGTTASLISETCYGSHYGGALVAAQLDKSGAASARAENLTSIAKIEIR